MTGCFAGGFGHAQITQLCADPGGPSMHKLPPRTAGIRVPCGVELSPCVMMVGLGVWGPGGPVNLTQTHAFTVRSHSGDDPDVDDEHRCRLIIDFVQNPDVVCV
jgi:hypothetical protein